MVGVIVCNSWDWSLIIPTPTIRQHRSLVFRVSFQGVSRTRRCQRCYWNKPSRGCHTSMCLDGAVGWSSASVMCLKCWAYLLVIQHNWLVLTGTMEWVMTFQKQLGMENHPNWRAHSIIFQRGRYTNHQPDMQITTVNYGKNPSPRGRWPVVWWGYQPRRWIERWMKICVALHGMDPTQLDVFVLVVSKIFGMWNHNS
jgi:hypothetical protein